MSKFLYVAGLMASAAMAQSLEPYTDPLSGIKFGRHTDPASGFSVGLALPQTIGTDFIGQITVPVSAGYGAISLGGSMTNTILLIAQPSGSDVVASLRTASGYTNPEVLTTNSTFDVMPIKEGISVNSTAFTYTFLCKGCITGDDRSWTSTDTTATIGWAYSNEALAEPSNPSGALNYHGSGFGLFGAPFVNATSTEYDTWAALATTASYGNTPSTSTPTYGNSTLSTNATVSSETYDYIVAGGGVAGLIVAERLAESGKSVLLLERGAKSSASTGGDAFVNWNSSVTQYDVPAMAYYLSTAKQTGQYCTDTASMAGCILGGSGMINAMMWVKPNSGDFKNWPAGWNWDDVKASADALYERTPGTILASADGERYDQAAYNVVSKFLSGNGFSSVDALNDVESKHDIFSYPPWLIKDGLRGGPIHDYLPLAEAMSNFKLTINAKVIRVIRSGSTMTGVEVEVDKQRQIINLNAGGAVVLTAGALSSPRLLINSGIGPTEQIETVQSGSVAVTLPDKADWINLPVGQGIKDHPIFTVKLTTKTPLASLPSTAFTQPNDTNVELFSQQSGLLSQSGQRLNFWTSVTNADNTVRYIQGTCNAPSNNTIQMKIYLTHGLTSSGSLVMETDGSTKFGVQPYLTTDGDKEAIKSFMQRLIDFTKQGNSTLSMPSNATAESLIASYTTGSHYVASAAMGASNDGKSVVGTDTKVWGTDNLFVADASMHPDLPVGNTQAIVMVVAEQAAKAILAADKGSGASYGSGSGSSTSVATPAAPYPTGTGSAGTTGTGSTPAATTTGTAGSKAPSSCKRRRAARRAARLAARRSL
ncbi:Cellobiose dehydrogenase [Ceratocystis lukuohia]|uniref:Cellobiose dehydrogenase n=1 Tax=Ceratocystis lukuohia TaxID=2019550 RepID=A0ABR4MJ42_9PEZI